MLFKHIIGQVSVKNSLLNMLHDVRVPHALMFNGPEGSGNLPAAFAFVQYLFCNNKQSQDSCGSCPSCLKVSKLIHPDLHIVMPIFLNKDKGIAKSDDLIKEFREQFIENPYLSLKDWFESIDAENKQPTIPTDEANDIVKKLSYTSYEGGYKIMIIWQPEKMNISAANKLLKILEEPPEQTLFLLVCNNPEQLLATIISRVQQIQFYKLNTDDVVNGLMEQFDCQPQAAKQAALLSDGSFRDAKILLQDVDGDNSYLQNFRNFMLISLKFDAIKAVSWIDENSKIGREQQKQFLQYGLEIFRDCLMFNFGSPDLLRHSGDEKEFIVKFSRFVNQRNYEKLLEEFNSAFYHVERNANPKILFMDLILKTNEYLNMPA
ncbi:MAG: DNA polymerase III subunit delta' [Bacteroidia bacterium]|nr:DNA polymerase III subunit delta' [Bacteroidia bacterium]